LQDLNRAFATGIYLNRRPEEFIFRRGTILVQIGLDQTKRTLLVQLEGGDDVSVLNKLGNGHQMDTKSPETKKPDDSSIAKLS